MGNSKQGLNGNSVLEVFVKNFPCCRKIREALVAYGLKRYGVMTIRVAEAIKASHAELPCMVKQASVEVKAQKHSPGVILQNSFCKSSQNLCKTPLPLSLFQ